MGSISMLGFLRFKLPMYTKNPLKIRGYLCRKYFVQGETYPENFQIRKTLKRSSSRVFLKKYFFYINLGNQLHYKKYNQKLHHVEYYDGK